MQPNKKWTNKLKKKTLMNVLIDGPLLPEINDPKVPYSTKLLLCLQNPSWCSPSDLVFPARHSKSWMHITCMKKYSSELVCWGFCWHIRCTPILKTRITDSTCSTLRLQDLNQWLRLPPRGGSKQHKLKRSFSWAMGRQTDKITCLCASQMEDH